MCEVDGARRQFPLLEKCVAKKNSRKMFEPKDKLDNLMRKNVKGKLYSNYKHYDANDNDVSVVAIVAAKKL